ncbi:hypothetical protein DAPPUDRAFT_102083 [Daphnia pulex]|uniref:Uncharacterized protein n=1 Tax=Daphnia pulex TaxID=6669 RepID=E9GFB9_DAPPU|nr:hypothetical protein DAPPUDRAFT_102083 [Daphnia pulex]|eukprot:EFX81612.1 hypothetical protein DAPPUDRAFT_102083 [Daphnia pulex]
MGSFKIVLILAVLMAVAYAMEMSADPAAAHQLAVAEETSDLEPILSPDLAMDEKKYKVYYKRKYKYKKKGGHRSYGGGGRGYGRGDGYGGRGGGGGSGGGGSSEESGR